jgi:chemotaxis protein methyltransferase CheR
MRQRTKYSPRIENVEVELLLQAVQMLRGINLQEYSGGPVRRKIWEAVRKEHVLSISGLLEKLVHEEGVMDRFLGSVLPKVPPLSAQFFLKFRREIILLLRTYPFARIWQIGCSSVSDLYLIAIILLEEGLYEKTLLYSTDLHEPRVQGCKEGLFPVAEMDRYAKVYSRSGGKASFTDYVSSERSSGMFDPHLKKNMIFGQHNLASGSSFNEFNLVLCRQELKVLNRPTQEKISGLLFESLVPFGILHLCEGDMVLPPVDRGFQVLDEHLNLYRKSGQT